MFTKVYLLNVPLENDYKHTLYFTSASSQQDYFSSKVVKSYTDFTYQRKDNIIRVPELYDNLIGCNYVMYQNKNKWYYAFITEMKYVNDDTTHISIQTDALQTWLFDFTIKPSFVEREHVSNDSIGRHSVPEQLECGEYIVEGKSQTEITAHFVIATTYDFKRETAGSTYINGIYHGVNYYLINSSDLQGAKQSIDYFLKLYADKGKSDSILGLFMLPDELTGYHSISEWDYMSSSGGLSYYPYKLITNDIVERDKAQSMGGWSGTIANSLDTYTPTNNKLLTYPYRYMLVSNNNGGNAIYQYEHFKNLSYGFNMYGAVTIGGSIRCIPLNYKGITENNEEGLNLGKFPICSYTNDAFTNWMTQNSVNILASVGSGILQVAGGIGAIATGAGAGAGAIAAASGLVSITSSVGQVYQMSKVPPQAEGNLNCGDVAYAMGNCNFTTYNMCIKPEYAKIIDNYFSMFGYKVNRVKRPNKAHRGRWWFTKTIDVNIDGAIPMNDLNTIKNCYNNGITFWRNGSEIGDYSLENKISTTSGAITDLD